jgi:hypothetical protein
VGSDETPDLFKEKDKELPVESVTDTGADRTAFLNIDLKINAKGGSKVAPMTAVFAPNPSQLSGNVDVILWFHGDKNYWNKSGTESFGFSGKSIQFYLGITLCKLREFILESSKRKFILVAPTLNDRTGISGDHGLPAGLVWDQADAEAYLQQAVNAVKTYMKANVTGVGNIIIAGHSGGGHLQSQMAQYFSGKFTKANEIWCFDSTYWGSKPFITWVNKGHSNGRLWVFSTRGTTAYNARTLMELTTAPMKFAKVAPPKPKRGRGTIGKAEAAVVNAVNKVEAVAGTFAHAAAIAATQIDILIEHDPNTNKPNTTPNFFATYGGVAGGHYEGMKQYLATLIDTSRNLS